MRVVKIWAFTHQSRVYFGRDKTVSLKDEFSGNLTGLSTGVFTDKTHSGATIKWDIQYTSICHGCSAGCNISAGERYGGDCAVENSILMGSQRTSYVTVVVSAIICQSC